MISRNYIGERIGMNKKKANVTVVNMEACQSIFVFVVTSGDEEKKKKGNNYEQIT